MALPQMLPDKYLLYTSPSGESDEQVLRRHLFGKNAADPQALLSAERQDRERMEPKGKLTREELAQLFLRLEAQAPQFPIFRGANFNDIRRDWSFSLSHALSYVSNALQEGPERSFPVLAQMTVGDFMKAARDFHAKSGKEQATIHESVAKLVEVGAWGWDFPYRHCRIDVASLRSAGCLPNITQYRRTSLSHTKSA